MEVGDAAGDNTVLYSTVFTYTQLWFSELISSPLENVSLVAWSKKKKKNASAPLYETINQNISSFFFVGGSSWVLFPLFPSAEP